MTTSKLLFIVMLGIPYGAFGAGLECTIPVSQKTPAKLEDLAKISEEQAHRYALESVKAPPTTYAEAELKVLQGCLVYDVYIPNPGKKGAIEIGVDAGDGTILFNTPAPQKKPRNVPRKP